MLVNVLGCHIPELFIITMTLYNLSLPDMPRHRWIAAYIQRYKEDAQDVQICRASSHVWRYHQHVQDVLRYTGQ